MVIACGNGSTGGGGNEGGPAASSSSGGDAAQSGPCPQGPYTQCTSDADCPCTHHCLPLVPNGVYQYCTVPCQTSTDCNHPELGITCPAGDTTCCQQANACLP